MYAQVEKQDENKSRVVTNSFAQRKSNELHAKGFVDNRPEAVAQRELIKMANIGGQSEQAAQFHERGNLIDIIRSSAVIQPMSNTVLQRALYIDDTEVKGDDKARVTRIKAYLKEHNIHFYYEYNLPAENLKSTAESSFNGKEGAFAIVRAIAPETREGAKPMEEGAMDGGKQDFVQRKLREVAELVRVSLGNNKELTEPEEKWFSDYVSNGLCLGFVKMLERYPEWMISMWEAMRTWRPPHGVSAVNVITELNLHIQSVVPFDKEGVARNFLEASLMATESYRLMDDDGGDQYGDTPEFLKQVKVGAKPAVTVTIGNELVVDGSSDDKEVRWTNVLKRIKDLATDESVSYHCIVYSDIHEMAVRFTGPATATTSILLSETEDVGIVTKTSWEAVKPLVSKWLGGDGEGYGVEVKKQTESYR